MVYRLYKYSLQFFNFNVSTLKTDVQSADPYTDVCLRNNMNLNDNYYSTKILKSLQNACGNSDFNTI